MKPFVVVADVEARQQHLVEAVAELQQQLVEAEARQQGSVNQTDNALYAIGDGTEIKNPEVCIAICCSAVNTHDLCSNMKM